MCTLESDEGEYIGSIAGHVNEEAELSANYFVSDEWGGIDTVSYTHLDVYKRQAWHSL